MHKTFKTVSLIAIISLIAKCFGAGRELTLSYCYGSSSLSDAYLLATTIPVTIFGFLYDSIGAGFIPACAQLKNDNARIRFTNNVINVLALVAVFLIFIIELYPEKTIRFFASGFDEDTLEISSKILKISVIGVLFSAISSVLVSFLHYHNSFMVTTARAIPLDAVVILSIVGGYHYNDVSLLSVGIPLSLLVSTFYLLPKLKSLGFIYNFVIDLKDEKLRSLLSWSLPIILSTAIADINSIVDRQFASYIIVGGISIMTYSSRIISIFTSLLITPLMTFMFPNFVKNIQAGNDENVKLLYVKTIRLLLYVTIPISFLIFLFSIEIVDIIFKRGEFNEISALHTANCLKYYSITIIACAVSSVGTKFFYAYADMWTPMKVSFLGVCLNIVGNFFLTKLWGLQGLAMASGISLLLTAGIIHAMIIKKYSMQSCGIVAHIVKICIICIVVSIPINLFSIHLMNYMGMLLATAILSLIFAIMYVVLSIIFKIKEICYFVDKI